MLSIIVIIARTIKECWFRASSQQNIAQEIWFIVCGAHRIAQAKKIFVSQQNLVLRFAKMS